jgi:hypothetical protein
MRIPRLMRAVVTTSIIGATLNSPAAAAVDIELRRDGSRAVPVVLPEPAPAAQKGFDWGDAAIGAAAGIAALVGAAAGVQTTRSRRAARRRPLAAER